MNSRVWTAIAAGCLLVSLSSCDGDIAGGLRSVASVDGGLPQADASVEGPDGSVIVIGEDGGVIIVVPEVDAGVPWDVVPPAVYVPRIKSLLTGLAATQAEIDAVIANPDALGGLINTWNALPQADDRWLEFFVSAFQQGQVTFDDYMDQFGYFGGLSGPKDSRNEPVMLQQFRESFPRTALYFVKNNQPFTKVLTTRQFMLTPPMAMMLTWSDSQHVGDNADPELQNGRNKFRTRFPNFTWQADFGGTVPLSETLDPTSPNYMHWNSSVPLTSAPAVCQVNPVVFSNGTDQYSPNRNGEWLQNFMFGRIVSPAKVCMDTGRGAVYPQPPTPQFTATEMSTWRMVTIRQPAAGEQTSVFFDLPRMRTGTELVLDTPRVGFFTTPSFFANWQTNTSNQARVTINQTLIVAMGTSFDGSKSITPVSEAAVNGEHAAVGSVCYGCHQTLDPMRQFFRQAYSLHYHEQDVAAQKNLKGNFAFDGVSVGGNDIYALGDALAAHPRFPTAWTQKLCVYANAAPCDEDDPDFIAARDAFVHDNYNFRTLVRALFSSPLVTLAKPTTTFLNDPPVVSIVRREQMCALLSNRLGLNDICALSTPAPTATQTATGKLAASLPGAAYSRGAELPALPREPTLFYRLGVEQVCNAAAAQVVDITGQPFQSAQPDAAIDLLMKTFLEVQVNDPRYADMRAVLKSHFTAAKMTSGSDAKKALTSTFVLACMAPSNTGSGL